MGVPVPYSPSGRYMSCPLWPLLRGEADLGTCMGTSHNKKGTEGQRYRVGHGRLAARVRAKCHPGEGRQVPFGQHKKIQEELERQQNRKRTSEEGLQGEEEERRLGLSSGPVCFPTHMWCTADKELTEQPWVRAFVLYNTLCSGITKTCSRGETKATTRGAAGVSF